MTRPALVEDLAAVLRLAETTPGAPQWPAEVYRRMLLAGVLPARILLVLPGADGVLAGYAVVAIQAGEAELEAIAVRPEMQHRGFGRELLAAALAWSSAEGAATMRLEVRASNVAARGLYEAAGFVEQGQRRNYYHQPAEDAVLMEWRPTGASGGQGIQAS